MFLKDDNIYRYDNDIFSDKYSSVIKEFNKDKNKKVELFKIC